MDVTRDGRPVAPLRLRTQLLRRLDRVFLAGGENSPEATVANELDTGRRIGDGKELRKRSWRPQHARVQHSGQRDVLDVCRPAGDFRWQVDAHRVRAHDAIVGGRLLRPLARDVEAREIPVALLPALREQRAQLGARLSQGLATVLDREAAGGEAFVGAIGGARRQDPDSFQRKSELVGGDLQKRRRDPLAELARRDGHRPVALEVHALREPARAGGIDRLIHGRLSGRRVRRGCATRSGTSACRAPRALPSRWAACSLRAGQLRRRQCRSCSSRTARPARR